MPRETIHILKLHTNAYSVIKAGENFQYVTQSVSVQNKKVFVSQP